MMLSMYQSFSIVGAKILFQELSTGFSTALVGKSPIGCVKFPQPS